VQTSQSEQERVQSIVLSSSKIATFSIKDSAKTLSMSASCPLWTNSMAKIENFSQRTALRWGIAMKNILATVLNHTFTN